MIRGSARDVSPWTRVCPRARVDSLSNTQRHHLVPGRMKLNFVAPITVTVVRTKYCWNFVGEGTKLDRFTSAEDFTKFGQHPFCPGCAFAVDRFLQRSVGINQVIVFKRPRLIENLVSAKLGFLRIGV